MPTRDLIYGAEMPRPQPARRLWHSGPEFATQRTLGDCCDRGGFRQVLSSAIRQTGENSGTPKGAAQFWFRRRPLHSCGGGFGWGAACRNGAGPAPSFRRLAGLPAQAGKGASGRRAAPGRWPDWGVASGARPVRAEHARGGKSGLSSARSCRMIPASFLDFNSKFYGTKAGSKDPSSKWVSRGECGTLLLTSLN